MNDVRVSVIVACFNDGRFLERAVASVETLPEKNFELIIVNDGSTDESTLKALGALRGRYAVIDQPNRGLSAARNAGIKASRGKYILPLDADNRIRAGYIRKGAEILDAHPEIAAVYADCEYFGEKQGIRRLPDLDIPRLLVSNYIDACAVFRKSAWEQCGGYDERIRAGLEDWDLWLGMLERGWKFRHFAEVGFDYCVRGESLMGYYEKHPDKKNEIIGYVTGKHAALYAREIRYAYNTLRAGVRSPQARLLRFFKNLLTFKKNKPERYFSEKPI